MKTKRFVLCRRDVGEIGAARICGRPIDAPNPLNWCRGCRSTLPWWPAEQLELQPAEALTNRHQTLG